MSVTNSNLNQRAAIWATIIIGSALALMWLPPVIWPSNESPNVLALVLSIPGFIVLIPGVLITSFVRMMAYTLFHHAEIAAAKAAMAPNSTDTFVVVNAVGFHLSIPFACALVVDWVLYFLIARQVLKARAQREATLNPPSSRS
jgi:hypothetical protein